MALVPPPGGGGGGGGEGNPPENKKKTPSKKKKKKTQFHRIEYTFPDAEETMAFVREKGMFSFYEDGHTECCRVRKVKPLRRQLKTLTAWMTGQRKDQSPGTRQAVPVVQVDPVFEGSAGGPSSLVKFNPLANVTSAEVWHFLRVMGERFLPFFFFWISREVVSPFLPFLL